MPPPLQSRPETDGLDDLLMAPEQHLHDAAIEREERRSRQGYATPADARAFLWMARQPRGAGRPRSRSTPSPRPTFARSKKKRTPPPARLRRARRAGDDGRPQSDQDVQDDRGVIEPLAEAGLMPERPRACSKPRTMTLDPRDSRS